MAEVTADGNGGPSGLHAALFAAKAEIPTLSKGESATVQTRSGGQYTYRYASLEATKEVVDPILRKHHLLWRTFPGGSHDDPKLGYAMTHVPTGQQETGEMPLFGAESSQSHGSAITYGRRYAVWAYLDLVGEEDDDGQRASHHRESRAQPDGVDMRQQAKGLNDAAINAARQQVGLPKLDKPWGSLVNIPEELAENFGRALDMARMAQ